MPLIWDERTRCLLTKEVKGNSRESRHTLVQCISCTPATHNELRTQQCPVLSHVRPCETQTVQQWPQHTCRHTTPGLPVFHFVHMCTMSCTTWRCIYLFTEDKDRSSTHSWGLIHKTSSTNSVWMFVVRAVRLVSGSALFVTYLHHASRDRMWLVCPRRCSRLRLTRVIQSRCLFPIGAGGWVLGKSEEDEINTGLGRKHVSFQTTDPRSVALCVPDKVSHPWLDKKRSKCFLSLSLKNVALTSECGRPDPRTRWRLSTWNFFSALLTAQCTLYCGGGVSVFAAGVDLEKC